MSLWHVPHPQPVIAPGALHGDLDQARAAAGHVQRGGDHYHMLYWGSDRAGKHTILAAQAPVTAPTRWQAVGGPLLGAQPDSLYNSIGPSFPFLLSLSPQRQFLYFCAWGRRPDGKLPNTTGVALWDPAASRWRYHDQHPVIPLDRPYDAQGTGSVWVLHEEGLFRMYYTAIGRYFAKPAGVATGHGDNIPEIGIAYAESRDGIHWHKPLERLLIAPRGFAVDPYEYIVSKPCVLKGPDGYTMWVNTFGTAYRVHRLVSKDGHDWQWAPRVGPEGELGVGASGAFDDAQRSYVSILGDEGELRCWYTGNRFGLTGMGYAAGPLG